MAPAVTARRRAFSLSPGDVVGNYVCVCPLTMGGMAELHVATPLRDPQAKSLVVIKRMLPNLAQDPEFAAMFLKEARLASELRHANIVRVLDVGEDDPDYYIVLEYIHGYDLRQVVREAARAQSAVPLPVAVTIAAQLCAGLHHAHEHRDTHGRLLELVHRDVTPSNVLLDLDGRVLLTDFGIARALTTMKTTRAGVIKGKLGYMSPEQCRDGHLDRRSDVFSVGVLLYEMTTGYRMFHAGNEFAVLNKISKGEYVPPTKAVPGYPAELERIVLRCVALDPSERFDSAAALHRALDRFADAQGLQLGTEACAAYVERLLGPKPLPEAPEARPHESEEFAVERRPIAEHRGRGRSVLLVAIALGVGGVAGGAVVLAANNGETHGGPTEAESVQPRVPAPVGGPTVTQSEARVAEDDAAADVAIPDLSAPEAEADGGGEDAEPAVSAPPARGQRRRKPRRPKPQPRAAGGSDAGRKILPPSMRNR